MLFENGRAADAIGPYDESVRLAPNEALLLTSLAQVQIEVGAPDLMDQAEEHLDRAVQIEPDLGSAWRQLAVVHGRRGETGELSLAMAELALIRRRYDEALVHSERAEGALPAGSPGNLRAQDIRAEAQRSKDKS